MVLRLLASTIVGFKVAMDTNCYQLIVTMLHEFNHLALITNGVYTLTWSFIT